MKSINNHSLSNDSYRVFNKNADALGSRSRVNTPL